MRENINKSRYAEALSQPGVHPYRTGYIDGLLARPCKNPYGSWSKSASLYLSGYMAGEEARNKI